MSKFLDSIRNTQQNQPEPIQKQIVQATNFNFSYIKPGINLVVTHNYDDINNLILSTLKTSQDKIIWIDVNNSIVNFKCDLNHIKINAQDIDDIFGYIKESIKPNSIIVISNFENIIIDIDPDSSMENPARASIISQFFKRIYGMLANNNSMMIIGHTSPAYEFYKDGNISPYPNLERLVLPKVPISSMIFLSCTITKITTEEDKLDIEVLKHEMEPIGKRKTV
jgi:hypothetical protein